MGFYVRVHICIVLRVNGFDGKVNRMEFIILSKDEETEASREIVLVRRLNL